MKRSIISTILCLIAFVCFAQKGTIKYLEERPGIYPCVLNDSITKNLRCFELIGTVANGGGYVNLDEDYCVIETANLLEVKGTFKNYLISNVLFYVSPTFKQTCFDELVKLYGTPDKKGEQYSWTSDNYILTYEFNPTDLPESKKSQAIGLFFRREDW